MRLRYGFFFIESTSATSFSAVLSLARSIGATVAKLHNGGLIHGDLTTSNMMLRGFGLPSDAREGETSVSVKGPADEKQSSGIIHGDLHASDSGSSGAGLSADPVPVTSASSFSYPSAHTIVQRLHRGK